MHGFQRERPCGGKKLLIRQQPYNLNVEGILPELGRIPHTLFVGNDRFHSTAALASDKFEQQTNL